MSIVNGPSKEAQLLTKPIHCGLDSQVSNNEGKELDTTLNLNPIEEEGVVAVHVTRQLEIRGEENKKAKCVTVYRIANHEMEVMGRNVVNE